MMLFKHEHVMPILTGRKTMTRRIWKKRRAVPGSIHQARTELFGKPFTHLKILKVHQEYLGNISDEDCVKEGGYTYDSFIDLWCKINKTPDFNCSQVVYVIEFKVIKN